jgi:hypothetical protein
MLVRGCREKEEAVVDSRGVLESKQSSAVAAAREAVSSVCDGVGDNEVNGQTSQRQGRRGGGEQGRARTKNTKRGLDFTATQIVRRCSDSLHCAKTTACVYICISRLRETSSDDNNNTNYEIDDDEVSSRPSW